MFSFFFTTAPLTCYLFHPLVLKSHFFPSSSLFFAQEIPFAIIFSVPRRGRKAKTPHSWVPPPKAHCFEPAYVCMFLCDLNNEQWCISHFGKCAFFHCARTHARELSDFTIVMCITSLSFPIQVGTIWLQNNNGRRMKEFFNKNLGFWKIRNSRGYWSAVTEQHNRQMCGPFYFPLSSIKSICNVLSNCTYISQCMCAPSLLCFLR